MISRVLYVVAVALFFYVLLPLLGQYIIRTHRAYLIRRLQKGFRDGGIAGVCTGIVNGRLRYRAENRMLTDEPPQEIDPRKTKFIILKTDSALDIISWKSISLLKNGTTLYLVPGICVFHEEKKRAALEERITSLKTPEQVPQPCRPWFTGAGAFCSFVLFLSYLKIDGLSLSVFAAFIAIFARALPWCPPGLFLTLFAHYLVKTKKNRQRQAVGFLLVAAGILLNISVIFFVVSKTGLIVS